MITWYAADQKVNEIKDGVMTTLAFCMTDDTPEG